MNKISALGIEFDLIDSHSLIQYIKNLDSTDIYQYIVTPNVDHILRLNDGDNILINAYRNADFVINDSRVLLFISKIFRLGIKYVTPGSDLTLSLLNQLENKEVCVVGPSTKELNNLEKLFPSHNFTIFNPKFGFLERKDELNSLLKGLADPKFEILFLCLGCPKQEFIANELHEYRSHGIALCVGASFDFFLGNQKRAPQFVQFLGFEWLYRMLSQPKRLASRYIIGMAKLTKFILFTIVSKKIKSSFLID